MDHIFFKEGRVVILSLDLTTYDLRVADFARILLLNLRPVFQFQIFFLPFNCVCRECITEQGIDT